MKLKKKRKILLRREGVPSCGGQTRSQKKSKGKTGGFEGTDRQARGSQRGVLEVQGGNSGNRRRARLQNREVKQHRTIGGKKMLSDSTRGDGTGEC